MIQLLLITLYQGNLRCLNINCKMSKNVYACVCAIFGATCSYLLLFTLFQSLTLGGSKYQILANWSPPASMISLLTRVICITRVARKVLENARKVLKKCYKSAQKC